MTSSNLFPAYFIRRIPSLGRRLPSGVTPEVMEIEMEFLSNIAAQNPNQALIFAKAKYHSFPNSLCIGAPYVD